VTFDYDRHKVHRDFRTPHGPAVLDASLRRAVEHKHDAQAGLPWEEWRDRARAIKEHAIAHLDELLVEFEKRFVERGGKVVWASSADDAAERFIDICRRHGATSVVKGKSMVS